MGSPSRTPRVQGMARKDSQSFEQKHCVVSASFTFQTAIRTHKVRVHGVLNHLVPLNHWIFPIVNACTQNHESVALDALKRL